MRLNLGGDAVPMLAREMTVVIIFRHSCPPMARGERAVVRVEEEGRFIFSYMKPTAGLFAPSASFQQRIPVTVRLLHSVLHDTV